MSGEVCLLSRVPRPRTHHRAHAGEEGPASCLGSVDGSGGGDGTRGNSEGRGGSGLPWQRRCDGGVALSVALGFDPVTGQYIGGGASRRGMALQILTDAERPLLWKGFKCQVEATTQ